MYPTNCLYEWFSFTLAESAADLQKYCYDISENGIPLWITKRLNNLQETLSQTSNYITTKHPY